MTYFFKGKRSHNLPVIKLHNNTALQRIYFSFCSTSWEPMAKTFVCPSFMLPCRVQKNQHIPLKRIQQRKYLTKLQEILRKESCKQHKLTLPNDKIFKVLFMQISTVVELVVVIALPFCPTWKLNLR